MIANKLKAGSHIRVVAPARTLKIISEETRQIAIERFEKLGITVSYAQNAEECDENLSSSVKSRIDDLHEAFLDPTVDAIFTSIGGFTTTEILDYLDYDIIKNNPKIVCGFSDITALCNAIYAKTGLVTYSGPHFSSFGMKNGFDYTLEYFQKALISGGEFEVLPCDEFSNDAWFMDQENRNFIKDSGHWVINQGFAQGRLVGGNTHLLGLLRGTQYFPNIKDCVLFIEHCSEDAFYNFKQEVQSLILLKDFATVKALVIGRFELANEVKREKLEEFIKSKPELKNIPIIANVSFGHTTPIITFPIGGECKIDNGKIFIKE
ncbi:MAG: LD-carboxypeptidase [Alphaproteobacteria bacterium]